MKKSKWNSVIIVLIVLLLLVAIVIMLFKDKEVDNDTPTEPPVEDVQEDKEEKDTEAEEKEEEVAPVVIDQEKETIKGDITAFKYGVLQQPVTYNTYDIYDDGSKVLVESIEDVLYHQSGYCATMDELKAESEKNATAYMKFYEEVLRLVNEIRASAGVEPVVLDTTLCQIAGLRAAEIEYSGKFSHTRPDDTGCFAVTQFYGYPYTHLAENIAQGADTPKQVVNMWKNNETDYGYMIDARFTKLGVGHSDVGINKEWVQVFSD